MNYKVCPLDGRTKRAGPLVLGSPVSQMVRHRSQCFTSFQYLVHFINAQTGSVPLLFLSRLPRAVCPTDSSLDEGSFLMVQTVS